MKTKNKQSKDVQLTVNNIKYSLKVIKKTASVVGIESENETIIIPKSIKYKSQEYIVTKIAKNAFNRSENIKSIDFPNDSKLRKIEINAFYESSVESITIPSSLEKLADGWCRFTSQLTNVRVMPNNEHFIYLDEKFIVEKSSKASINYDILHFARRDIKTARIPKFIRVIKFYAFQSCEQLTKIEIPKDSDLTIIEDFGFSESSIESIDIPSNLIKIGKSAFSYCLELKKVNIPKNSKLQIIDGVAFNDSLIEELTIPSKLTILIDEWCVGLPLLKKINIMPGNPIFTMYENKFVIEKSNPLYDIYDTLIFVVRDIKIAKVPSFITKIGSNAFEMCKKLQKVEFQDDSELRKIDKHAFSESSIYDIKIPQKVVEICEEAFCECENLRKVEFHKNSRLKEIKDYAFAETPIESFIFPSSLKKIEDDAFRCCHKLQIIEIDENSKLQIICAHYFNSSENVIIMVPKHTNENITIS